MPHATGVGGALLAEAIVAAWFEPGLLPVKVAVWCFPIGIAVLVLAAGMLRRRADASNETVPARARRVGDA